MGASGMHEILDLTRYPIDRPESAGAQALAAACRAALDEGALSSLPGFVHPAAVAAMAAEAEALLPDAVRYDRPRQSYAYREDDETWPEGHPRRALHPCRYHQLLNYQIPNDSLLRRLYYWEPLTRFLRRVLGYETLHRSDCPHLALTVQLSGAGDTNGWHFDGNDAVFSLLLQAPAAGGAFEVAPNLRSAEDQNYDGVAAVFAAPETHAVRPVIDPGSFTLFKGDLSLHRVSPVEGEARRIIALFSYDREPGTVFPQSYIDELHGRA